MIQRKYVQELKKFNIQSKRIFLHVRRQETRDKNKRERERERLNYKNIKKITDYLLPLYTSLKMEHNKFKNFRNSVSWSRKGVEFQQETRMEGKKIERGEGFNDVSE